MLKNDAEYDDVKWLYFLVIRWVIAIQKAPKKTKKTPRNETTLVPKGSAEITTPKNPIKIAKTLIILILSLKKKWDKTSNINGDVKSTG